MFGNNHPAARLLIAVAAIIGMGTVLQPRSYRDYGRGAMAVIWLLLIALLLAVSIARP